MSILQGIQTLIRKKPVLFTTPGHFQKYLISKNYENILSKKFFSFDFSEIQGLDNLQNPSGIILKSQEKASEIYNSGKTFYLVNGSTSGIIALMLASCNPSDKVLISRNVHISVMNALALSGAYPVWIENEWDNEWNIPVGIKPEKLIYALDKNPEIKALWITRPTYEGVFINLKPISEICAQKKIILICDEAHGALWTFSEKFPQPSIHCGADACVQSLHKTALSLTQGAVIHLSKNSRIDPDKVQKALNLINTTSPSYLILSSIESSIEYLNSCKGRKKLDNLMHDIEKFKYSLKKKVKDIKFLENSINFGHDPTKIFFKIGNLSGYVISDFLENKFNIETELNNDRAVLALTGIGTDKKKLKILEKGIIEASKKVRTIYHQIFRPYLYPKTLFSPSQAFFMPSKKVNLMESVGLVSKETIVNYPPGIPLIGAGEIIQEKHLEFLKNKDYIEVLL